MLRKEIFLYVQGYKIFEVFSLRFTKLLLVQSVLTFYNSEKKRVFSQMYDKFTDKIFLVVKTDFRSIV